MELVTRELGGIAVSVPRVWQDRSVVSFVGPPSAGYSPSVVVTRRPLAGTPTLERLAERQREAVAQQGLEDLRVVEDGLVLLDGRRAHRLSTVCRYPVPREGAPEPESTELRQDRYTLVAERTVLTVTLTCRAADHDELAPLFERIAAGTSVV